MATEIHSGVQEVAFLPENASIKIDTKIEEDKVPYTCELCNIKVTSKKILQRHLEGRKHTIRMERNGKTFKCDLCNIVANSQSQLEVHLRSSKHKARLAYKERMEFISVSSSKGVWIILIGMLCVFINVLILFKMIS